MTMRDTGLRRSERRRSPRYQYRAPLEIEWGSARLKGRTRDISENGMFIESEDVLWVGATIKTASHHRYYTAARNRLRVWRANSDSAAGAGLRIRRC